MNYEMNKNAVYIEREYIGAWQGEAYENDIFRAGVDTIARHCAKLKGVSPHAQLNRLLQLRPNKYMSAFDFLYKLATNLYTFGNAWSLIDFDKRGNVKGLYPLSPANVEISDSLIVNMQFRNGKSATFDYNELIHIRRHFCTNDILGASNSAINSAVELAEAENQGITYGIKNAVNLRGILKYTSLLNDKDLQEIKNKFVNDYLSFDNSAGVIALDTKAEYIPIKNEPIILNSEQSSAIRKKIFSYLGIPESVVEGNYTEDTFSAFYESVIEPFALALSLEMTSKLLTEREINRGEKIYFESSRLQFSNNATKVKMIAELMPLGILSINQALEMLNLPPVAGGDKRLQSLNFIDSKQANEYQKRGVI